MLPVQHSTFLGHDTPGVHDKISSIGAAKHWAKGSQDVADGTPVGYLSCNFPDHPGGPTLGCTCLLLLALLRAVISGTTHMHIDKRM